jgi:hypothetical protein
MQGSIISWEKKQQQKTGEKAVKKKAVKVQGHHPTRELSIQYTVLVNVFFNVDVCEIGKFLAHLSAVMKVQDSNPSPTPLFLGGGGGWRGLFYSNEDKIVNYEQNVSASFES